MQRDSIQYFIDWLVVLLWNVDAEELEHLQKEIDSLRNANLQYEHRLELLDSERAPSPSKKSNHELTLKMCDLEVN